jgi:5-methylcytosine-specific restriction endonuclease McrA
MAYSYPFKTAAAQTILAVWNKGAIVPDKNGQHWDPKVWRYDKCGKPIKYSEHGNTASDVGWEIDHIKPIAKGGTDDLSNLQPLQWENNRAKGDTYPW